MKTEILILFFALAPVMTQAQVNYAVSGNTAYVTNSPNASGNVVIATTYDGYPVTSIGDSAFAFCSGLTSITIPNSVSSIGDVAFGNCFGLTNIAVDAANPNYSSTNRVLFDKDQATLIQYPIGLANSSYTIPDSVTSIGDDAFVDCSSLTSVTIGANVTSIGEGAFAGCSGLTSITIPNSVTSIGNQEFYDCGLTGVTIGNGVTSIGFDAFEDCTRLTSVTIPDSVTSIGNFAFFGCSGLRKAYFQGNAPLVDGAAGSADTSVFYGEPGTVYYYAGTTGWGSTFGSWPTALWYQPQPQILSSGLGAQNNQFGFTISWATNLSIVVQAATNLANPVWIPLSTNTLINGTNYFSDPQWTNYPSRFYRITSTPTFPGFTGNLDVDMYNAAVADGTANGGVPAVMLTENGGPFRVTAVGPYSVDVCYHYSECVFTIIVGTDSCSSTTLPSGTPVIQFGGPLECGFGPYGY